MSLPDRMWEELALERPTIEAQSRFHRSYAELEEPPFDVRSIVEMLRYPPPLGVGHQVVDLLSEDGEILAAQLREDYRAGAPEPWIRPAEIADSLRIAAIANLLLHTPTGRAELLRAGHEYRAADLSFGDFLIVAAVGDRDVSIGAADRVQALLTDAVERDRMEPAQLRYLLLAAAPDASDMGPTLAETPPARQSIAVGATSQPFSTWWRMGELISRMAPGSEEIREDLAEAIIGVAEAHGRQLMFAMADRYHWSAGLSEVDIIDLDLAGAVAISARVMTARRIRPWNLEEEFAGLSPPAQVSIVIGLQLGGEDPPSENQPEPDPRGPTLDRHRERQFGYGFG